MLKSFGFFFCLLAIIIFQAQSRSPARTPEQVEQWRKAHKEKLAEKYNVENQKNLIIKKERGVLGKLQEIESKLATNENELAQYRK